MLLGDALHTAHFSIGSGTKLAMEDAINLFEAFEAHGSVPAALARFQGDAPRGRREDRNTPPNVSALWTENPARYWRMEPIQACFSMLSRAKAVTYENLRMRDPRFVETRAALVRRRRCAAQGFDVPLDHPPPPMFTPFRVGQMVVREPRRGLADEHVFGEPGGIPGDFHLRASRPLRMGGAGLVFAEMTAVSETARITPGCPGIYSDEQVAAWKRISDFVHEQSRRSSACSSAIPAAKARPGAAGRGWTIRWREGNWELVAASPLAFPEFMHVPREITRADMDARPRRLSRRPRPNADRPTST